MWKHWVKRRQGPWWTVLFGLGAAVMIVVAIIVVLIAGELLLRNQPQGPVGP